MESKCSYRRKAYSAIVQDPAARTPKMKLLKETFYKYLQFVALDTISILLSKYSRIHSFADIFLSS